MDHLEHKTMPDEPMTLIERLRNPAWEKDGSGVKLNIDRTVDDMKEAADEIERARAEIKFLRKMIVPGRQNNADIAGVTKLDGPYGDWVYHHVPVTDLEEIWKRAGEQE